MNKLHSSQISSVTNHLEEVRKASGLSKAEAARRVGVNASTLKRWEQGHLPKYGYHRQLLCTIYNKTAQELWEVSQ